jgi:hypothetical protein
MIVRLKFCRRILLTSAGLFVAVALVVAAGVIPPVKADIFFSATPQRAVVAFWGNVAFNLLAAAVLVFIALRARGRSRLSTTVLGLLAFLALLLALALTDAAFAFQAHGPAMQTVRILLFICSVTDFLSAALVTTAVFLFPKKT